MTGFFFPTTDPGYKQAFLLVQALEEPKDRSFNRIFPSHDTLFVLPDNLESHRVLDAFETISKSP
jgi:hypothetical protein